MKHMFTLAVLGMMVIPAGCLGPAVAQTGDKYGGDPVSSARMMAELPPLRGPRRRVAVAEFDNKTVYGQHRLGGAASDILTTELVRADRFIMLERQRIAAVLKEQQLGMEMVVDAQTAARVGKMLGAQAVVVGTVSKFGVRTEGTDVGLYKRMTQIAEVEVDIRIIDTTTAQILFAESGAATVSKTAREVLGGGGRMSYDETLEQDALRKAIQDMVGKVIMQLSEAPWYCSVAAVQGQAVVIDAGQQSGLARGTELTVYNLGDEIRSPTTGLVVGRMRTYVGRIRVDSFMGDNGAIASVVEGNVPAVGAMAVIE